jgi:CDP-glycerol:poly(glycerophosphate) glycerophosphotransferase
MIDALAYEPHFVAHLAPVWRALPAQLRGTFLTDPALLEHCRSLGIHAEPVQMPMGRVKANANADGPPALVASYGDQKRGRLRGYGTFARLEHGIGQSYGNGLGNYAGGQDCEDVGLFLMPNYDSADRWQAAYADAAVEVVGCSKLDQLPAREPGTGPVIALAFHWPCHIVPETMPAFHHFRRVLPALAERYQLLGHGHPRGLTEFARRYRRMGIEVVRDFDEVCRRADLLIADNTSALYEFAATGRPVVVLNSPTYRRRVHHGLRFWDAADVGIQVDRPEELLPAVDEALADAPPRQRARQAALGIVYAYRSGAAQRAAGAISAWLATRSTRNEAVA